MSRYLERAGRTARLVDVNLDLALDRPSEWSAHHWRRLFDGLQVVPPDDPLEPETVVARLALDVTHSGSLFWCIASARENARQVRDEISSDVWEQMNRIYWQVKQASSGDAWREQPHDVFRAVIDGVYMFDGIAADTMTHGEGWHYLQLGRFIERAYATANLVDVHVAAFPDVVSGPIRPSDISEWAGLLHACTAFEAYCRCHTARLDARRIVDFLLLDEAFPRSLRFAVDQVDASLRTLTKLSGRPAGGPSDRLAGRLRASLGYAVMDEIVAGDLRRFLESIRKQCGQIHDAMTQTFISGHVAQSLSSAQY
jgi:uncharacterized alpha-E superfamily protein